MSPYPYEVHALHADDHAELMEAAERERAAIRVVRARRMERWARRSARLSAHLNRLARIQRARLS